MGDHCPACRIARELREHRDNTAAEWSVRRGTLNFARVLAERVCPDWRPEATAHRHEDD